MKNNKGMSLVLLILIIVILLVLVGYGVALFMENKESDKNDTTENITTQQENNVAQFENTNITQFENSIANQSKANNVVNGENEVNSQIKLTSEELIKITQYLNEVPNNGFIVVDYRNIENVKLSEVLYNGVGISIENETITKEYEEIKGEESLGIPVKKLKSQAIDMFLREKTGVIFNLKEKLSKIPYSEKYDAYYFEGGDTNYSEVSCTDGYKIGNRYVVTGKYVNANISDEGKDIVGFVVTLTSTDSGYRFVSNELK